MTTEIRFGRCHGPGCDKPAANHFCSEDCWRAWHQGFNAGDQTLAKVTMEWRHPYLGEIREYLCGRHEAEVLAALRVLGIGCGGTWADGEACVRCVHEGKRARDWLKSVVVPGLGSVES